MKTLILGADRRLHGLGGENQPTKIADWIRECPVFDETRLNDPAKTTALDRSQLPRPSAKN
jgi:hypothetical protein